jgi:acyl transferase domain-containing protein/acyl carrier protein
MNLQAEVSLNGREIAVIGMACRTSSVASTEDLWTLSMSGKSGLSTFTREELRDAGISSAELDNPNYVMVGTNIADKSAMDAALFGYGANEARYMDPQMAKFHECVWEALEQAGHYTGRVAVYVGAGESATWLNRIQGADDSPADTYSVVTLAAESFLSTRISYNFNFTAHSQNITTTCSTSLVAVHEACQSLLTYQSDMALAGGSSITPFGKQGYLHQPGVIFSHDGSCRPFDADAAGTVDGEGTGVVLLKRLEEAIEDNDNILAVIKGSATNNDGNRKQGFTAPSVLGQSEVISDALELAEVDPASIGYVEAHGTATPLGDPIEVSALTKAYGPEPIKKNGTGYCVIGSIKSQIGHTETAAGVIGLIRTIHILQNKQFPPSAYFKSPNPELKLDTTAFRVNTKLCSWESDIPRRAAVSSFCLGGTNAHVILEEAQFERETSKSRPIQMLLFSANTKVALEKLIGEQLLYLEENPDISLADISYTRQVGRKPLRYRKALAVASIDDVKSALGVRTEEEKQQEENFVQVHSAFAEDNNQVAFLFPGQGVQYVNMGRGLYETESVFREWLDKGFSIAREKINMDLKAILFSKNESDKRIYDHGYSQPLLFIVEYALAKLLMHWGVTPSIMIGHSAGEYTAACLADVFTFNDAIVLLAKRGALMQSSPFGNMLTVRAGAAVVRPLLEELNQDRITLSIAAENSLNLCVASGDEDAISRLKMILNERKIQCSLLHINYAAHSHHLDAVLEEFRTTVAAVKLSPPNPNLPYINNANGEQIAAEQATSPDYWVKHMRNPVQFSRGVETLVELGTLSLLEIGPGRVLSTFVHQNPAITKKHHCINLMPGVVDARETGSAGEAATFDQITLFSGLARLFTMGSSLSWQSFYENEKRARVRSLPTYPFERKAYWMPGPAIAENTRKLDSAKRRTIDNWYSIPIWQYASPISSLHIDEKQNWLIFMDDCGLGKRLVSRLSALDKQAVLVLKGEVYEEKNRRTYMVNPYNQSHYSSLITALEKQNMLPTTVVHLWGIETSTKDNGVDKLNIDSMSMVLGYTSQIYIAQSLGKIKNPPNVSFKICANYTQRVNEGDYIVPENALNLAPSKVIPSEYPFIECQFIDCSLEDIGSDIQTANCSLIDELLSAEISDSLVAYRDTLRRKQEFCEISLKPIDNSKIKSYLNGCFLISGGLGELGLAFAKHLAKIVEGTLILFDYFEFVEKKQWCSWLSEHEVDDPISIKIRLLQGIESSGAEILVVTSNVDTDNANRQSTEKMLENVGRIDGIFFIEGKSNKREGQQFGESAMLPTTLALNNVLTLTRGGELRFVVLFSSLTSLVGGKGKVDRCAESQYLEAIAKKYDDKKGTRYLAINWPDWNAEDINYEQAIESLHRILGYGLFPQIVVSPYPVYSLTLKERQKRKQVSMEAALLDTDGRPELSTEYHAPTTEVEVKLSEIWAKKLNLQCVGIDDHLLELGADSLLFLGVISDIQRMFQLQLTLGEIVKNSNVREQANIISGRLQDGTSELLTLSKVPTDKKIKLSYAQKALWDDLKREGVDNVYHLVTGVLLDGHINESVLKKSLKCFMDRQEALKLCLYENDGEIYLKNNRDVDLVYTAMNVEDEWLRDTKKSTSDQEKLDGIFAEILRMPFDLFSAPLMRAFLITYSTNQHLLLVDIHHIINDQSSRNILIKELSSVYSAYVNNKEPDLPELPVQFSDFSYWQRKWHASRQYGSQLQYWVKQLANYPVDKKFPLDFPRSGNYHYETMNVDYEKGNSFIEDVERYCERKNVTLRTYFMAVYIITLYRYSKLNELIVTSPYAERDRYELENLMGMFLTLLPYRVSIDKSMTLDRFFEEVSQVVIDAHNNANVNIGAVLENKNIEVNSEDHFQVSFQYFNESDGQKWSLSGLNAKPFLSGLFNSQATLDLSLVITKKQNGVGACIIYNAALFELESANSILNYCVRDAGAFLTCSNKSIAEYLENNCL